MLRFLLPLIYTIHIASSNLKGCKHSKLLTWTSSMMLPEDAFVLSSVAQSMTLIYFVIQLPFTTLLLYAIHSVLSWTGRGCASEVCASNNSSSKVLVQKVSWNFWLIIKILKSSLYFPTYFAVVLNRLGISYSLVICIFIYFYFMSAYEYCLWVSMYTMHISGAWMGIRGHLTP